MVTASAFIEYWCIISLHRTESPLQAIIHSLTHIECVAVDLAWDAIARFGCDSSYQLPRAFFDDFVAVAEDEARHFQLLAGRLQVCFLADRLECARDA
jgi:uncharacterized ferritin-like protein (DUF455 family)